MFKIFFIAMIVIILNHIPASGKSSKHNYRSSKNKPYGLPWMGGRVPRK